MNFTDVPLLFITFLIVALVVAGASILIIIIPLAMVATLVACLGIVLILNGLDKFDDFCKWLKRKCTKGDEQ